MKRLNFVLNADEDAIKLILPLKSKSRTKRISIIISENLEYIGYSTLHKIKK